MDRQAKAQPSLHMRCHANRGSDQPRELSARKSPQHGDDTIMARHRVKAKGKRDEPESGRRDPAPSQIADDHRMPRDPIQFSNERFGVGGVEVVKKLGAEHDVHAAIGEGQRVRVARRRRSLRGAAPRRRAMARRRCRSS